MGTTTAVFCRIRDFVMHVFSMMEKPLRVCCKENLGVSRPLLPLQYEVLRYEYDCSPQDTHRHVVDTSILSKPIHILSSSCASSHPTHLTLKREGKEKARKNNMIGAALLLPRPVAESRLRIRVQSLGRELIVSNVSTYICR